MPGMVIVGANRAHRSDLVKFKTGQRACLLPVNGRDDRSQEKRELHPASREQSELFRSGVSVRTSDFMGGIVDEEWISFIV